MADHRDNEPTQLAADNADASSENGAVLPTPRDDEPNAATSPEDYTEFHPTSGSTTGFDRAAQMARKARSESGRLLKKRFVLEDVLGEGGMGLVYKARDLRKVEAEDRNPYIAVKVLGQQFREHPQAFVSLQQEAVKSQKLAHPNIVTVYDFDRDGDTIYLTMELLKGDPLDALLRLEAPFSKEVALRYFRDLCAGLEYAHKRDLVHSDFKPGNIFVTTGGTVKILDFGIARAAHANALSHDFDVGELGALTPAYATLEMFRGDPPSFSDDIYALACVLYLMLTGEHPYQQKSAHVVAKEKLKPARPDCLNNREWHALSAALSIDRSRRPASIAEFRDSLLPPKRGGAIKGLAVVVMLIVAIGGWLGYQQYQAQQAQAEMLQARLQQAKDCFFSRDFQCSIENALVVKNLAPDNQEARKLLEIAQQEQDELDRAALIDQRLADAGSCLEAGDFSCTRVKLQEVLSLESGHPQAQAMLEQANLRSRKQRIDAILARAGDCLDAGNISCAEAALQDAEHQGADQAILYPLLRERDELLAERQATEKARSDKIEELMARSEQCLRAGDFTCSEEGVGEVLAIDPGHARAIELNQSIAAARQQRRFNEQTVSDFLRAAEECYNRKDYSCTIAKSESALAIIPGHGPSEAMIDKAQLAQRRAKMNISIQ